MIVPDISAHHSEATPQLPTPRSPRELLSSLAHYDDAEGLDAFLRRFDLADVSPHQIYYAVLGRLPESARVAATPDDHDPRRHLKDALFSREFQAGLIARVLRAFPEKKRLFFVHVPKCAGCDLASHLMQRYGDACLHQLDQEPVNITPERLPQRLHRLVTGLATHETIAVMGHIGLDWVLSEQLLRFGDSACSVVRDPIDMAVSKVNFVLTMMQDDPAGRTPIVLEWIRAFDLHRYAAGLPADEAELKRLALEMLRNTTIVPRDSLCSFLGVGTTQSALDLCASADIELTTVSRYEAWLGQRWGITESERVNESKKILSRADLAVADIEYLGELRREDMDFYRRVDARIGECGRLSIGGAEL